MDGWIDPSFYPSIDSLVILQRFEAIGWVTAWASRP